MLLIHKLHIWLTDGIQLTAEKGIWFSCMTIKFEKPRRKLSVDPEKSIDKIYAGSDDSGIYCSFVTGQDVLPQVGCFLDSIVVFNSLAWSLSSNINYK